MVSRFVGVFSTFVPILDLCSCAWWLLKWLCVYIVISRNECVCYGAHNSHHSNFFECLFRAKTEH
jgi:hypothetical protein